MIRPLPGKPGCARLISFLPVSTGKYEQQEQGEEWLKRYLPAEIVSLVITVAATLITYKITGSRLPTALYGTWFGNIGYFGYILTADIIYARKAVHKAGGAYHISTS